jgi:hypothetical protein
MASKKMKTNEDMLKALLKDLHTFEAAILRERLVKIAEITRDAIGKSPTGFNNPFFDHTWYLSVCDKIDKHLGFEQNP